MKIPRWMIGMLTVCGLALVVIGMLGFAHAFSHVSGDARCFDSIRSAQWPKWIGCAMAAHENLAGGLIGLAGAIFAAWLAYSSVQDQLDLATKAALEADRLKAQQQFMEIAEKIDALKLAKGYLNAFANHFPDPDDDSFLLFNFVSRLADLHKRKLVYLSESAAAAPDGFGRSITTIMWRIERLAEDTEDYKTRLNNHSLLHNEIEKSVRGVRDLAASIDRRLPVLERRLANLAEQVTILGGKVEI